MRPLDSINRRILALLARSLDGLSALDVGLQVERDLAMRWDPTIGYDRAHGRLVTLERRGLVTRSSRLHREFPARWRITDAGREATR